MTANDDVSPETLDRQLQGLLEQAQKQARVAIAGGHAPASLLGALTLAPSGDVLVTINVREAFLAQVRAGLDPETYEALAGMIAKCPELPVLMFGNDGNVSVLSVGW